MIDTITLAGNTGGPVKHTTTSNGLSISSFRLAVTPRIRDRATGDWRDGETSWFTVSCFNRLADNVASSLETGQRVLVHGELRVRTWVGKDGQPGVTAEVVADSVGHDLAWLVTTARRPASRGSAEPSAAVEPTEWATPGAEEAALALAPEEAPVPF